MLFAIKPENMPVTSSGCGHQRCGCSACTGHTQRLWWPQVWLLCLYRSYPRTVMARGVAALPVWVISKDSDGQRCGCSAFTDHIQGLWWPEVCALTLWVISKNCGHQRCGCYAWMGHTQGLWSPEVWLLCLYRSYPRTVMARGVASLPVQVISKDYDGQKCGFSACMSHIQGLWSPEVWLLCL